MATARPRRSAGVDPRGGESPATNRATFGRNGGGAGRAACEGRARWRCILNDRMYSCVPPHPRAGRNCAKVKYSSIRACFWNFSALSPVSASDRVAASLWRPQRRRVGERHARVRSQDPRCGVRGPCPPRCDPAPLAGGADPFAHARSQPRPAGFDDGRPDDHRTALSQMRVRWGNRGASHLKFRSPETRVTSTARHTDVHEPSRRLPHPAGGFFVAGGGGEIERPTRPAG